MTVFNYSIKIKNQNFMNKYYILFLFFYLSYIFPAFSSSFKTNPNSFITNLSGVYTFNGTWTIYDEGLNSDLSGKGDGFLFSETKGQNFVYEADVTFHNRNESAASLLFGSNNDIEKKNMYVANINPKSGLTRLFKFQYNSHETEALDLVTPKYILLTDNNTYHLCVTVVGNHIVFEINGVVVANTADYLSGGIMGQNDAFVGHNVGLLSWDANCTYQNVHFTELTDENNPQLKSLKINALTGFIEQNIIFNPDQYIYIVYVNNECKKINLEFNKSEGTNITLKVGDNYYSTENLPINPSINIITLFCKNKSAQLIYRLIVIKSAQSEYYNESFRGQYHYSVRQGWANDPNGLVYYNGVYHLFHQFYYGLDWGYMHWAHAISNDLIYWEECPVAFYPDEYGTMFSGCAVYDENNTSGLFKDKLGNLKKNGGIVTFITADGNGERIIAAYSDNGINWKKYNDVLIDWTEDPLYDKAFRDPKVFRYQNKWFMVIAGGTLRIYSSDNLLDWKVESTFPNINTECPDLVRLPVIENEKIIEYKWLLSKAGRYYKVGNFEKIDDKWQFVPDDYYKNYDEIMNFGKDAYAFQTYYFGEYNENQKRVVGIYWMNNFDYFLHKDQPFGNNIYNGTFSLQYELFFIKNDNGRYFLCQKPINEYDNLRNNELSIFDNNKVINDTSLCYQLYNNSCEIKVEYDIHNSKNVGVKINTGNGKYVTLGYNILKNSYYLDRRFVGVGNEKYAVYSSIQNPNSFNNKIKLHIFIDRNSVELFTNNYSITGTALIPPCESIEFFSDGLVNANIEITPLKSIWKSSEINGLDTYIHSQNILLKKIGVNNYCLTGVNNGNIYVFDASGSIKKSIPIKNFETQVNLSDISNEILFIYVASSNNSQSFKLYNFN